jgi:hypothetical protein
MEGIVRQIWKANPQTDICFVYTIHKAFLPDYEKGLCNRSTSAHERVADHYGIPSINMALRVAQLHGQGKLVFPVPPKEKAPEGKLVFAHDECHPTDAGHELFTEVITDALKEIQGKSKPGTRKLREPLCADNWEDARLVELQPSMLTGSWKKMDTAQGLGKAFHGRLPTIWHGGTPGDKLTFKFRGSLCRLYDLVGPDGGIAVCTVDGKPQGKRPRFDWYCTYWRLAAFQVAAGLPADAVHTVRVEISPKQPGREPVLERVRNEKGFDPKKYDGTNLWLGYIMLRGELVEE